MNTIVYNTLITACERDAQWPLCLQLLSMLDAPSVVSYNVPGL